MSQPSQPIFVPPTSNADTFGSIVVENNAYVDGNLTVNGSSSLGNVTADNIDAVNGTFSGSLTAASLSFSSVTVNNLTVNDLLTTSDLTVTGTALFDNAFDVPSITVTGTSTFDGVSTFNANVNLTGASTLSINSITGLNLAATNLVSTATANRVIFFPDESGTVALVNDPATFTNLTVTGTTTLDSATGLTIANTNLVSTASTPIVVDLPATAGTLALAGGAGSFTSVAITNTTGPAVNYPLTVFQPNITPGNIVGIEFGQNTLGYNSGYVEFSPVGNMSTSNTVQIGLASAGFTNAYLNIDGNGDVVQYGTTANYYTAGVVTAGGFVTTGTVTATGVIKGSGFATTGDTTTPGVITADSVDVTTVEYAGDIVYTGSYGGSLGSIEANTVTIGPYSTISGTASSNISLNLPATSGTLALTTGGGSPTFSSITVTGTSTLDGAVTSDAPLTINSTTAGSSDVLIGAYYSGQTSGSEYIEVGQSATTDAAGQLGFFTNISGTMGTLGQRGVSTIVGVTDSGQVVTGPPASTNSTLDDGSGNMSVGGNLQVTGNLSFPSGGTLTVGTANVTSSILLGGHTTVTAPASSAVSVAFPSSSGTLALTGGGGAATYTALTVTGTSSLQGLTTVGSVLSVNSGASIPIIQGTTTGSGGGDLFSLLAANLATSDSVSMQMGQSAATSDAATLAFKYLAAGSSTNTLQLGTYGNTQVAIDGQGNIIAPANINMTNTSNSHGLYSFNASSSSGGVYYDSNYGNVHFVGGNATNQWIIQDMNTNSQFSVNNSGTSSSSYSTSASIGSLSVLGSALTINASAGNSTGIIVSPSPLTFSVSGSGTTTTTVPRTLYNWFEGAQTPSVNFGFTQLSTQGVISGPSTGNVPFCIGQGRTTNQGSPLVLAASPSTTCASANLLNSGACIWAELPIAFVNPSSIGSWINLANPGSSGNYTVNLPSSAGTLALTSSTAGTYLLATLGLSLIAGSDYALSYSSVFANNISVTSATTLNLPASGSFYITIALGVQSSTASTFGWATSTTGGVTIDDATPSAATTYALVATKVVLYFNLYVSTAAAGTLQIYAAASTGTLSLQSGNIKIQALPF
jgi:hypothetical protein